MPVDRTSYLRPVRATLIEMKFLSVLLLCVTLSCSNNDYESIRLAYAPPEEIPEEYLEDRDEYLKGFRSGWEEVVNNSIGQDGSLMRVYSTYCEQPMAITNGFYAGQEYGNEFLKTLSEMNINKKSKIKFLKSLQNLIQESYTSEKPL